MSEYWKSTPKYWCKHCSTYVRDTKLERKNHESTAKHQSALKRFLRDLHRGHENEQREKDRAKREIDRLNGITNTASSSGAPSSSNPNSIPVATPAQRQQQWEQLAEMGIDLPTELRRNMAMAGEWTVTSTRVIDEAPPAATDEKDAAPLRKRLKEEDEHSDHEDSVRSLFKKPRKWGRDTKQAVDDAELDALLSTPLVKPPKKEEDNEKPAVKGEDYVKIKKEEPDTDKLLSAAPKTDEPSVSNGQGIRSVVKEEEADEKSAAEPEAPAVVFKKRKPKNLRQK